MDQAKQEEVQLIQICPECGKRVAASSGSMTAWLFKESRCSCEKNAPVDSSEGQLLTLVTEEPASEIGEASYRVLELVGRGGMGEVYKGLDLLKSEEVAIKFLHPALLSDGRAVSRFNNEAASSMGLEHPGLVKVRNFGLSMNGAPCIVMDFLEGESLDKMLARRNSLPIDECQQLFLQLCDAISYLHSKQIIHRDLKPSNIILQNSDSGTNAVIVDFGIAKVYEGQNLEQIQFTQTGEIVGVHHI